MYATSIGWPGWPAWCTSQCCVRRAAALLLVAYAGTGRQWQLEAAPHNCVQVAALSSCVVPKFLLLQMQEPGQQAKNYEQRLKYGRFFYRFPDGESAADVYDRMTMFQYHFVRDIASKR